VSEIVLTKDISASAAHIWEVLSDFGNVTNYHPLVRTATILGKYERRVGAIRRCEFFDNNSIVETISHWVEREEIALELSEITMPLKTATITININPTASMTNVSMQMNYSIKYGLLGVLLDKLIMRRMIRKMLGQVLFGLEQHILTGKIMGGVEYSDKDYCPAIEQT